MIDASKLNTGDVLKHCFDYCQKNHVKNIVLASTTGLTGSLASEMNARDYDGMFNLVIITHCKGFRDPNKDELEAHYAVKIRKNGARIHTGTMVFHNINDALRARDYPSELTLMADTLRMFGQGIKVAVEVVLMATDAGLIPEQKSVFAIAGTGLGADTGALILSANSRRAFKLKVKDLVIKPRDW